MWRSEDHSESMHNREGALSESLFIYHRAIELAVEEDCPHRFLSVGLGLGYVELILAAHWLKKALPEESFFLRSFEKESLFRDYFLMLIGYDQTQLPDNWREAYDQILSGLETHFEVPSGDILDFLNRHYEAKSFLIDGALLPETEHAAEYGCIFYDPFSGPFSPELWTEKQISRLLKKTAPRAVLSTYAAKGVLNRLLKEEGFSRVRQQGFGGKRESTLALKKPE